MPRKVRGCEELAVPMFDPLSMLQYLAHLQWREDNAERRRAADEFAQKTGAGGLPQDYDPESGKYGSGSGAKTKAREPYEMTSAEFERKAATGTYGDWYMTNDGHFVQMRGSGGIGSERVQAYDINGDFVGHYNRSDLKLVQPTSQHIGGAGNEAADSWLKDVSERSAKLKKDNDGLLLQTGIYDRYKRGVERGELSEDRFLELQKSGSIISDDRYNAGRQVQSEIDAVLNTDLVVPENPEHRAIVEKALDEGKDVPERVLAEYPDLEKKKKR